MNIDLLQTLLRDEDAFKKAFKKVSPDRTFSTDPKNEIVALLKGQFRKGRLPYINQVTFPDGSQLRLKFVDTIKQVLDSKGKAVPGKESFLSYVEVTVAPAGQKAYFYTTDVKQVVWGTSKSAATEKHGKNLAALKEFAAEFDIDLSTADAWCSVYSQSY